MIFLGIAVVSGEVKTAKYGGAFLETGVDARILSMGGAGASISGSVSSVFWNPAGLVFLKNYKIHGMHSERFSGMVNWDFIGIGSNIDSTTFFGAGFFRMGVDGIPVTRLLNPDIGLGEYYYDESGNLKQNVPQIEKMVNDVEYAFFLSIAKIINNRFYIGSTVKIIRKMFDSNGAWGMGFDAGLMYRAAERINIGLTVHDITTTIVAWNTGTKERILPSLRAGVSYYYKKSKVSFLPVFEIGTSFDANNSSSVLISDKASVDLIAGLEISYSERLFFRAGMFRKRMTLGAGFSVSKLNIDYGFSSNNDLGNTHRLSLEYGFGRN
ncbi:hypothetical protein DRQ07_00030 [candidate division KSB1 bacterium]|nr:MAG: hypothetical protein DRQ07_00030 [candidate division KSB1 bacterium]